MLDKTQTSGNQSLRNYGTEGLWAQKFVWFFSPQWTAVSLIKDYHLCLCLGLPHSQNDNFEPVMCNASIFTLLSEHEKEKKKRETEAFLEQRNYYCVSAVWKMKKKSVSGNNKLDIAQYFIVNNYCSCSG